MFSFILASSVLCREVRDSWITEASDAIIIAVKVFQHRVMYLTDRGEGKYSVRFIPFMIFRIFCYWFSKFVIVMPDKNPAENQMKLNPLTLLGNLPR